MFSIKKIKKNDVAHRETVFYFPQNFSLFNILRLKNSSISLHQNDPRKSHTNASPQTVRQLAFQFPNIELSGLFQSPLSCYQAKDSTLRNEFHGHQKVSPSNFSYKSKFSGQTRCKTFVYTETRLIR